jgi:hypothetical protein
MHSSSDTLTSLVRLDRLEKPPYELRVYAEPGDPRKPLCEEMRTAIAVANIQVTGAVARATLGFGDIGNDQAWIDFDASMAAKDVNLVLWERHKNGRILVKKRRIK